MRGKHCSGEQAKRNAEQMGDLELIPLTNQQSGHSRSVLSLHGAAVHECALSEECCYVLY